nr:PfaD family polyunsaturated fatty acid/polyketide biosynthesis protein [Dickeya solani]
MSKQHNTANAAAVAGKPLLGGEALYALETPLAVVEYDREVRIEAGHAAPQHGQLIGLLPPMGAERLGDRQFQRDYGVRFSYYAGAMANGIHSSDMVVALGQQQILGIFGAGGLSLERIAAELEQIQRQLPNGPFGVNLLHNPGNPAWELGCVTLLIERQVRVIEASAYINLSAALVYYRAAGLTRGADGRIQPQNRIIAKVSRREVAQHFLRPAPENLLKKLLDDGLITAQQAELARQVPMADDITVEGDSGGHTDQGLLACIFRSVVALRDELQAQSASGRRVRIGAAGGLGTPHAVLAAFALGAAYVVTGSINQACVEAGTSEAVKQMLGKVQIGDVATAPSADMFELGAKVQVMKQGSMYAVRAQKLYALYKQYDRLEDIPAADVAQIEKQIFHQSLAEVWQQTVTYFERNHQPQAIVKAEQQPKKKNGADFPVVSRPVIPLGYQQRAVAPTGLSGLVRVGDGRAQRMAARFGAGRRGAAPRRRHGGTADAGRRLPQPGDRAVGAGHRAARRAATVHPRRSSTLWRQRHRATSIESVISTTNREYQDNGCGNQTDVRPIQRIL